MHRCKGCIAGVAADVHFNLVRSESEAYIEQTSEQQQWSGNESALQLLLLPESTSPLPIYRDSPEYLNPFHCRLCLQPLMPSELVGHLR